MGQHFTWRIIYSKHRPQRYAKCVWLSSFIQISVTVIMQNFLGRREVTAFDMMQRQHKKIDLDVCSADAMH